MADLAHEVDEAGILEMPKSLRGHAGADEQFRDAVEAGQRSAAGGQNQDFHIVMADIRRNLLAR